MTDQTQLWCACGNTIWRAGLCARCHRRARLSRSHFGGRREVTLARDGAACVLCAGQNVVVHHRDARKLITLCRRHHASVHHRAQLWFGAHPLYAELWSEQHRLQAAQLELPFIDEPTFEQVLLFGASQAA